MPRKKEIDEVDMELLRILQVNANQTNQALARQIGLTPGPTRFRVYKLLKRNIIHRLRADINYPRLGFRFPQLLRLSVHSNCHNALSEYIQNHRFVIAAFSESPQSPQENLHWFWVWTLTMDEQQFNQEVIEAITNLEFMVGIEIIPIEKVIKNTSQLQLPI